MSEFELLFSPYEVRGRTVPNRIAVTAHATGMNPLGHPSDQFIEYNVEKAKNGVGLLMTMGSGSVHPTAPNSDWGGINNWDESIVPHLTKMAKAVKQYDTVLMAQISHRGRRAFSDVTWLPMYAPSDIPEKLHRHMPHVIQEEDIDWLVDSYVQAALRLQKSGFDGAEISAAHGHLIDSFWSPAMNNRTDRFGGSLENRMRFGNMVIDAVRDAVGEDFVLSLRITGDELLEGGLTNEDMQEIARLSTESGKIDILNVIGSTGETEWHQGLTVPSMNYQPGLFTGFAGAIRSHLQDNGIDVPVLPVGRIVHPAQAEQILAEGQADFVGMNRAIIADPELPKKAKNGELEDIRLCMGANEGCIGRIYIGKTMVCVQNPVIGNEVELATYDPASESKHVVIVGGGPAGLEAARTAAKIGHKVTLLEKEDVTGGQIRIAQKAPNRDAYGSSVDWLLGQAQKLGVDIQTGHEATVDSVLALNPDAVIIATGSTGRLLDLPGNDNDFVVIARDVIAGKATVGDKVLFVDEHHHQEGLSVAEYIAAQGKEVTVVSREWMAGLEIDGTLRPDLYARLDTLGVQVNNITNAKAINPDGSVVLENFLSHREWTTEPYDTVVVAAKGVANDSLWHELKGKVDELHCIGDAFAARGLYDAMLEGTRTARKIGAKVTETV